MITVITRAFDVDLEVRESERTITGVAVPYGQRVQIGQYFEEFAPGAFEGVGPTPLMATHPRSGNDLPIGVSIELRNDQDALHGTWKISKTEFGDDLLELIKDRAINALSVGFIPVRDRWASDRSSVVRVRADLDHVALVRVGAYPGALISSLRASTSGINPLLRLARRHR
jgi:HK97 family phage prohead protease